MINKIKNLISSASLLENPENYQSFLALRHKRCDFR